MRRGRFPRPSPTAKRFRETAKNGYSVGLDEVEVVERQTKLKLKRPTVTASGHTR